MATNKYQIVVQGEASETDSDEEIYITSAQSIEVGLKILGEAPETDSEGELDNVPKLVNAGSSENTQTLPKDIPPLVVANVKEFVPALEDYPALKAEQSAHCKTLLQQKLQETNARLCSNVTQMYRQVFQNAAKEIHMATTHLNNSQNGIINASHSIRLIVDDLRSVSEKIDIITSCNLLPDIIISTP